MPGKKQFSTFGRTTHAMASLSSKRHCLVFFPLEGSHGIWPEHLIRSKGRFGFEAKYGTQWFQCRIDKEGMSLHCLISVVSSKQLIGTLEECQSAQRLVENPGSTAEKQWSSVETELSDSDDGSSENSQVEVLIPWLCFKPYYSNTLQEYPDDILAEPNKKSDQPKKTADKQKPPISIPSDDEIDAEDEVLREISKSLLNRRSELPSFKSSHTFLALPCSSSN